MGAAWSKLEENDTWRTLPRWAKFGCITVASHVLAFWGPNVLLHLCYRWIKQYKIQADTPPPALVSLALRENLMNDLVLFPLLSWPLHRLLTARLKPLAKEEAGRGDQERAGWSGLYFGKTLPSWGTAAWQIFVAYLMCEFCFAESLLNPQLSLIAILINFSG